MAVRTDMPREPRPTAWLYWLAFLIAAGAAGLVYFLRQEPPDTQVRQEILVVIMLGTILTGVCLIAATSRWWMRR
jgi:hypothetical protein